MSIARKKPQQNRPNLHPHLSLLPLQQFISSLLTAAWLVARQWSTVTADSQVLQMGVGVGMGVEVGVGTQEPLLREGQEKSLLFSLTLKNTRGSVLTTVPR